MLKFFVLLQCVMLGACAFGKRINSQWDVLEGVGSTSCHKWPITETMLSVHSIKTLKGANMAFISSMQMRDGKIKRYYTFFDSEPELDPEKLVLGQYGAAERVLGSGEYQGKAHLALLKKQKRRGTIEVRSLQDNIVRQTADFGMHAFRTGQVIAGKKGFWLSYKDGDRDISVEELPLKVLYYEFGSKAKASIKSFKSSFDREAQLLAGKGEEGAFVVWGVSGKTEKDFKFYMTSLDEKKRRASVHKQIELPVESAVESWSAIRLADGLLLAYVDGDSLVGQSKLKIARIHWKDDYVTVGWVKSRSLLNEHVSDPYWMKRGAKAYLMLPKWVDEESTLAVYTVGEAGIENAAPTGIFPKGVRMMDGFVDKTQKKLYAIMRYRKNKFWQYELCKLEDI